MNQSAALVASQIISTLRKASRVLLVVHQHPDGDTLGAGNALGLWLQQEGKEMVIFCATAVGPDFSYLPLIDTITSDPTIWEQHWDTIVVLDSGDLSYAGVDQYNPHSCAKIINIDHHATNDFFGDLNLVLTTASSTCELIYRIMRHSNIIPSEQMATAILTGIITDTDNFTNAATTPLSMEIASSLLANGGQFNRIKDRVYRQQSIQSFSIWSTILSRLTEHASGIVYTYMTQDDLAEAHITDGDLKGITNFLNVIEEGTARMILKEMPDGQIKGSFRTTRNDVDVSALAQKLGGGGHKKAAGFTIKGPMETAIAQVFKTIA